MRYVLFILILCFPAFICAQTTQSPEQIKARMAEIRRTTNWDDPAEAAKANAEIKKLAGQLSGGKPPVSFGSTSEKQSSSKPASVAVKTDEVSRENVLAIATRFYNRSYKVLDAVSKSQFDQDFKKASDARFDLKSVHSLTSKGGVYISFSDNTDLACVYMASAVKAMPSDTLSVNNFGGYLRLIDSVKTSLPVLLYANKLFNESPIILTQIGNSYFELKDYAKAETYYKEALKFNPDFGQAHTSLCDLYIVQNRLEEAILELFAGVKNMGCSYMKASSTFSYLQQQSENAADAGNSSAKEKFWDETKKQVDPADALAPLVPDNSRVRIPSFPNCNRVEDWLEGGGWTNAYQSFQTYHSYLMSFNEKFTSAHNMTPDIAPGAVLRDYADARFAIDCILKRFLKEADDYQKEYQDRVDQITGDVNDAKERYLKKLEGITARFKSCWEGCGTNAECIEECRRRYCSEECPNANEFNQFLSRSYFEWRSEFDRLVTVNKTIIDDLYGFAMPWLGKIESPYWSLIYAYEIKRVALSIAGNCYGAYPQTFQALSHNDCGTDCSVYANPAQEKPDEVNNNDPNGNQCPPNTKEEIPLGPCSISQDCESWEFGCAAGAAFSFKRNKVKKTTSVFFGAGVEGDMGAGKVGGKFGGEITVGDDYSVDGGLKGSVSGGTPVPATKGAPVGVELEYSITVMGGLKTETTKIYNPIFK